MAALEDLADFDRPTLRRLTAAGQTAATGKKLILGAVRS